jgi:hypothetical protein
LSIKSIDKNFNGDSNREGGGGGETGRMRYKDRYGQREREISERIIRK